MPNLVGTMQRLQILTAHCLKEEYLMQFYCLNTYKNITLHLIWFYLVQAKEHNQLLILCLPLLILAESVETGQGDSGDTDIIYLTGVNQSHTGFEIESKVALHEMVDLDVIVSVGEWKFDGDANGDYQEMEYNEEGQVIGQMTTEYEYALDEYSLFLWYS